ncbi:hypothetical protein ENSA5_23550 [Enhygromyxa salina]|uniref:Lipid/polyisoprenoid-binding YceI-like domain-containing protein n=1 Tax=Enhygromyxa salina TaxID=215803 RepID=A0A2S9YBC7_9BACT|nr:YceI family protein [Enhygromyxa salina]PRQ02428.1 hypothetical protein ENSA5_23550 [Enhygromyxa salina]
MRRSILLLFAWSLLGCDRPDAGPKSAPEAKQAAEPGERDSPTVDSAAATPEDSEPSSDRAAEAGTDSGAAEAASAEPTTSEALEVDRSQSKVGFAVARATVGHVGHFKQFESKLRLEDGHPVALEINVELGSVAADRKGLTQHLKSPDFFHVDQFPSASFAAERITPKTDAEPGSYEVSGTMRLHGVTQELEFPAAIDVEAERVVGRATLEISAKAFGIDYEGMEAELAEDAVQLEVELVFPRAS